MGGCLDGDYIHSYCANDEEIYGCIQDNNPGCGLCSNCCYSCEYDESRIRDLYAQSKAWLSERKTYYVCWTKDSAYGKFRLKAKSLEDARELAQKSLYEYTSIIVTDSEW